MSVLVIAEAGVNHNGSVELAKQLVDAAKASGADAVKFQTFSAERLASRSTPKVAYQLRTSDSEESHYEMLRKLELSQSDHVRLKGYCDRAGILFASTPYSREDAEFLAKLDVPFFKVASADLVDRALHEFLATTAKDCLLATGMATMGEIARTLGVYDECGSRDKVVLMQCVSSYPAEATEVNLRVLTTLRDACATRVGFSDHTLTSSSALAAVALGAVVIEKHFTLDKTLPGPDHALSTEPREFASLVRGVREVARALGDGVKRVCESEKEMRAVSRKSIVLAHACSAGHVLQYTDLAFKRPGLGLSPMDYPSIVGKAVRLALPGGHVLRLCDLVDD